MTDAGLKDPRRASKFHTVEGVDRQSVLVIGVIRGEHSALVE